MALESLSREIRLKKNSNPIRFAYMINVDTPEKHKLHINKFFEIYIYVRGDADYIVGDSCFTLKRGDVIIVNQYEMHNVMLKNECLYERFYILIPVDSFDEFYFNPFKNISKRLVSMDDSKREKALKILYGIRETLAEGDGFEDSFKAYGLLLEFLALISDSAAKHSDDRKRRLPSRLPRYISDILIYINANASQIDSAEQIAKKFGLSLPYLSVIFKNNIGTSLKAYIQAKKVAYAKELLDNDYSVTEACYESGFNDCSYFIKVFKQHIGVTPLKYKKVLH